MILTVVFCLLQLLSCLRAEAASAAGAEANEPHAPPPPKDTCDASARMVDELMPAAVAFLGSPRESTVMAAMPVSLFLFNSRMGDLYDDIVFCSQLATAYVNRLKDSHAARLMPPSSASNAEGTLRAILDAVIARSSFPDESVAGVDFSDGDDKYTKELEGESIASR